jgi:hypothetical protein
LSPRIRWAVAVLAAMAAFVSNASAQVKPGTGSLGGSLGVPIFLADSDTKTGQVPRLLAMVDFQYVFSPHWRLAAQFGYGWIGYKDWAPSPYPVRDPDTGGYVNTMQDVLTKFQPVSASMLYAPKGQAGKWGPYVGGGVNLTRMEIVNKRKRIQDPATFDEWVNWGFGVQALAGAEYYIPSKRTVSLDFSAHWSYLFSKNTTDFPSGFTDNDSYLSFNFGVNVYFWPIGHAPVEIAPDAVPEPTGATPSDTLQNAPAPAPAPPDTTQKTPAPPAPAPPDTTQKSPAHSQSILVRPAPSTNSHAEAGFGAFGVTTPLPAPLPAEAEPALVCPAPASATKPTGLTEDRIQP